MGPFGIALLIVTLPPHFARTAAAQDTVTARDTLPDTLRSVFRLSGDRLRRFPIDDPRHALVLIPGVRLTSPDIGITPGAALLIRGSPAGRGNVYVDGVPLRFQTLGGVLPRLLRCLALLRAGPHDSRRNGARAVVAVE